MKYAYKTRAEQRLEHLSALKRPLTEGESDELRRSLHAVYVRNRKNKVLAEVEEQEAELLKKLEAEERMPEWHSERRG